MTTYEIIEKQVEAEMVDMDITETNYPARSGFLRVSLIIERRDHQITHDRLTRQIKELETKLLKLNK